MATRRTFLGWLSIMGAAILAVPRRFIPLLRRTRSASSNRKGMLFGGNDFVEALAELEDPSDIGSVRALADSVLQHDNTFFPPMPDEIEKHIKSRFVQAEVAYRLGRGPAVHEQDLAVACNLIAARLALPEPALTSRFQLRLLRMQQSLSARKLMEIETIGEGVPPTMSPLQAAVVMKSLLVSKRCVAWYWVPPAEWDATRYETGMQTLRGTQERLGKFREEEARRTSILKAQFGRNPRNRDALSAHFTRKIGIPYRPLPGFSSLDVAEQMNLVNEAFAKLRLG